MMAHNAILPLGQLSKETQKDKNKDYKNYRFQHSRKCSTFATNEDVFNMLICTSQKIQ